MENHPPPLIHTALTTVRAAERTRDQAARATRPPRLHPSYCGGCPRKGLLHARKAAARPLDAVALERMRLGTVYEADTGAALRAAFGERLHEQVALHTDIWSGTADFVLDHGTDHPVLIEHKTTGEKSWDWGQSLPRSEHLVQLALYGMLYQTCYGIAPELRLYYTAWAGKWAEFSVTVSEESIEALGQVTGAPRHAAAPGSLHEMVVTLEQHFTAGTLPPVLPSALQEGNCVNRGRIWCDYHDHCFPGENA